MAEKIFVCDYGRCGFVNVYARKDGNKFRWFDDIGESLLAFDTIEEAKENFLEYMEEENPNIIIEECK